MPMHSTEISPRQIAAYGRSLDRVTPGANAPQVDWVRARAELGTAYAAFAATNGGPA